MILGLSTHAFTLVHVAISLIAIVAGIVVARDMLTNKTDPAWTGLFLIMTIATSVTGFFFPLKSFGPPQVIGALSLAILAVALLANYSFHLAGRWRAAYVVTALLAFYFNVFVAVVQSFQKIPALQALAPTQSEPPFAVAQGIVLVLFVALGFFALRRFRPRASLFAL